MNSWVDLHTHVLPGVDDGAADVDVSLAMLRKFRDDGVKTVVATPHFLHPHFKVSLELVRDRLLRLQNAITEEGEEISVCFGAEVRYRSDLASNPELVRSLTLNETGKYLLLELPFQFAPPELPEVVFALLSQGVTPILAHAERYTDFQESPELIEDLVRRGALVQVTAGSVVGQLGRREKKLSRWLLKRNLVHVLASDAHDPKVRAPGLRKAVQEAGGILGKEAAVGLVQDNPTRIIAGEPIPRHL